MSTNRSPRFPVTLALGGLALLLGACATPAHDARIRELEQQQARAAIARDRAALEQIFAPDFRVFNPSGGVANKAELINILTTGTNPYASAKYETHSLEVHETLAFSTGMETVVMAQASQGAQAGQTVQRRVTQVWRRQDGDWRLALRQATNVLTPAAAPR